MPAISIIVPTFNRGPILTETLGAIHAAIAGLEAEVIVVNDSKTTRVETELGGIRVFDNPGAGAASARNFGARNAGGRLLLFVDDDIIISARHVQRTLALHAQHPGSCFNFNWKYSDALKRRLQDTAMGRFICDLGQTEYRGWVPDLPWAERGIFEVPRLASFYFSIERGLFLRLGGFNEAFKHQGGEDDEFSLRMRGEGIRLMIDPEESVIHNEADRIELRSKLERMKTGALNKRQGFDMGLPECRLIYPAHKHIAYTLLSLMKPLLLTLAEGLPNTRRFDALYRRIVLILTGTVIFEGYRRKEKGL